MAVGFDTVMVGDHSSANFATSVSAGFDHHSNGGLAIVSAAFSAGDLRILWHTDDNNIGDLTRTVTYGGVPMVPAAVAPWGTGDADAWTEAFVLFDTPPGKHRVAGKVSGGASGKRNLRLSGATYLGVDSIGAPVIGSGNGTAMTISAEGELNDRLVAMFGSLSGISGFNGTRRYLDNSGVGLLIGDAAGTSDPQDLTATRQKAGTWGGIVIPLNAADTVVSCPPLVIRPRMGPVVARREHRIGGLRREVYEVPLGDLKRKFIATAKKKSPNDVKPITMDWEAFLAVTQDLIEDFWFDAPGLEVTGAPFTPTDATLKVGGGVDGNYPMTYHVKTMNGEYYSRTIILPVGSM